MRGQTPLWASTSTEWTTPPAVVERVVRLLGGIDLDPAADAAHTIPAGRHYTQREDGLAQPWAGRVYLNPPYGRLIGRWVDRLVAAHQSEKEGLPRMDLTVMTSMPDPPRDPEAALCQLLREGMTWGDAGAWLRRLPPESVDLFFTSPPYADARSYSRIHPDRYVEWFLPFARSMLAATKDTGSFVINIKNRVARSGPLKGQRHPYVYELVLALQHMGWRWIETYIWAKPNAVPGRFGPRTKDAFEYVYHFAKGSKPYFNLDAIRVPYKTPPTEIARRRLSARGRRNTAAGFGRDRISTYRHGAADPGNVVIVPQTYNQFTGVAHTAPMPEGLAEFFIRALTPPGGVVIDPFAGSGTTQVVARRLGHRAGGLDIHRPFVEEARRRLATLPLTLEDLTDAP